MLVSLWSSARPGLDGERVDSCKGGFAGFGAGFGVVGGFWVVMGASGWSFKRLHSVFLGFFRVQTVIAYFRL